MKRILGLFDMYFLILMIVVCAIAIFVDANTFKKQNQVVLSKTIRKVAISVLSLSLVAYVASRMLL